ncbi:MAG: acetyl-CoA carboxylase biotin carboxyl carrier protein subunit [Candidatus Nealsonbacteria bacterium]|nr:acetyl-CoA carboxylase biotin carboxyl carrier protein subunit [Candidatus Nealsonbacteria bacterium]
MKLKIKEKEYDVEIDPGMGGQVKVVVNGNAYMFGKAGVASEISVPQTILPKRDFSSKTIKAALAGAISEVFVKEGDLVKEGQKLLTLSAMKMENEIVSEFVGKIKEIKVKQNDKVKEGDDLILLA